MYELNITKAREINSILQSRKKVVDAIINQSVNQKYDIP